MQRASSHPVSSSASNSTLSSGKNHASIAALVAEAVAPPIDHVQEFPSSPKAAAKRVAGIFKNHPGARLLLCVDVDAKDSEYIEACSQRLDPIAAIREILQSGGCDQETCDQAANVLPLALQVLTMPEAVDAPSSCVEHFRQLSCRMKCAILLGCAGVLLVLVAIAFEIANQGWRDGLCNLSMFWNRTCSQDGECAFAVNLQEVGKAEFFMVDSWTPRSSYNIWEGRSVWHGDSFRCCDDVYGSDADTRQSCCNLWDASIMGFCDDWYGKVDTKGEPCPTGKWPCRFQTIEKVDENGYDQEEIEALEVAVQSYTGWLIVSASMLFVVGFALAASSGAFRYLRQRGLPGFFTRPRRRVSQTPQVSPKVKSALRAEFDDEDGQEEVHAHRTKHTDKSAATDKSRSIEVREAIVGSGVKSIHLDGDALRKAAAKDNDSSGPLARWQLPRSTSEGATKKPSAPASRQHSASPTSISEVSVVQAPVSRRASLKAEETMSNALANLSKPKEGDQVFSDPNPQCFNFEDDLRAYSAPEVLAAQTRPIISPKSGRRPHPRSARTGAQAVRSQRGAAMGVPSASNVPPIHRSDSGTSRRH